ncbi:hypothetical protein [Methanosarcina siciliae]|nr:hypothetical protein [Methanosarcina siciliae]
MLKEDYMRFLKQASFFVKILAEDSDRSKWRYGGLHVESLKLKARV